jgi:hypothetical protein
MIPHALILKTRYMRTVFVNSFLSVLITLTSYGQDHISSSVPNASSQRSQIFFGELLGNGMTLSVNYDFRFAKSDKGFGMRMGAGFFYIFGIGVLSFPFSVNHVSGKAPHYFEASMGLTYAATTTHSAGLVPLFQPGVAYRYQPNSGFFTKLTICPLVSYKDMSGIRFWGGVAFGHDLSRR